jgi:hypothetical protein
LGKSKNNGEDKPNWGMLHTYMEKSQGNPLHNYYILIKMLKKRTSERIINKQTKKNVFSNLYHSIYVFGGFTRDTAT